MNQFKYCPKCAGNFKIIYEGDHPRLQCEKCGFIFYQNSKATVSPVIVQEGKVLLAKRKFEPRKGTWNMPGGFVETGEHPIDGLHRETMEELGIEIEVGDFLGFFMDKYGEENYDTMNLAWICKIKSGEIQANDDVEESKWFDLNNIPENLAFKSDREMLEAAKKYRY
jgi:ADP-ribose pyrophosphatase YjhB (NUDIX family)